MRIGIDARFVTHPQPGGFKTYTSNLLLHLPEVDSDNEYILYIDRAPKAGAMLPYGANVTTRVISGALPVIGMPWREQLALSSAAAQDRLDVFHAPCLTGPLFLNCRSIVTIHDMIWARHPTGRTRTIRRPMDHYYRLMPRLATRRADAIVTVSHASKQEIVSQLQIAPERIFVTHEGYSSIFHPADRPTAVAQVRARFGLEGPFVLAIGSADPRKNLATLIAAYAELDEALRDRYQLAIVWTHSLLAGAIEADVARRQLGTRVRFLSNVSDTELAWLYNAATLFVFPSLHEGFGLPLLEAMACGTPVIAANNSSIPEIACDGALLTNASEVPALSQAMAQALQHQKLRDRLVANGLARAATFSWEKCARDTVQIYRQVAAR